MLKYIIILIFYQEEYKIVDQVNVYKLNRKTMVYVDKDVDITIIPKIWGKDVTINLFTEKLIKVKELLEDKLQYQFNICLVNYYEHGKKAIGWHSDNEGKGNTSCIASLSLGAERNFMFRKMSKEIYKSILLEHGSVDPQPGGSLIVMGEGCQEHYQHSLPVDKQCKTARLNLKLFDSDRYIKY